MSSSLGGRQLGITGASATATHDEFGGQDDVRWISVVPSSMETQRVDGDFAQEAARLANGGERRIEVARQRDVIEARDHDVFGNAQPIARTRVDHADRGLIVGASEGLGQWLGPVQTRPSSPPRRPPRSSRPGGSRPRRASRPASLTAAERRFARATLSGLSLAPGTKPKRVSP